MKIKILVPLLLLFIIKVPTYSQSCDLGGCSTFTNLYPTGTFSTTSLTWQLVSDKMNAGNYTLFNVTAGNTYDWTYCSGTGVAYENWDAELTLYNNSDNQILCYSGNSNNSNCPNAPWITYKAQFTGTVKLLTTAGSCGTNTGSPYSALAWRCCEQVEPVSYPTSVTVTAPSSASFTMIATGAFPTYSWEYSADNGTDWSAVPNSTPYSGINSETLTINPTSSSINGYLYRCHVVGTCSELYSNWVTLTVNSGCTPPASPSNLTATVVSSSQINLSWSDNSDNETGFQVEWSTSSTGPFTDVTVAANTTSYTVSPLSAGTTYYFRVESYNGDISCLSSATTASQTTQGSGCIAPSIISSPTDETVNEGGNTTFSVSANGSNNQYRWQESINNGNSWTGLNDGGVYSGTTTNTLSLTNVTTSMNGYKYECFISSTCTSSTTTSNAATLTIGTTSTPTINSITFTNVINGHENVAPEYTLYNGSAYTTSNPVKICADGSTSTYIKINVSNTANLSFRILDENGNSISDVNKYGQLGTQYIFGGNNIEIPYTHPNYMDASNPYYRTLSLQILYNGQPISGISFPIHIYRAPMLLVHGLWGDGASFEEMDNYFQEQLGSSNIVTWKADYSANNGNAKSFNYNSWVIPSEISKTFNQARKLNFSCGKVDIVAHSMGGILSRLYLQSSNPAYLNDIHTLTTINTPHSGTQAADVLLTNLGFYADIALEAKGYCVTCGAVSDLKIGSTYFQTNLNGNKNVLPSLGYTSDYDSYWQYGQNSQWVPIDIIWFSNSIFFIYNNVLQPSMLPNSMFNNEVNDLIVPFSSQKGGVTINKNYNEVSHSNAEKNQDLFSDLLLKLGENPSSSIFNSSGFQNAALQEPSWFNEPYVIPFSKFPNSNDTVKIFSPINNQIFNTGDTINIKIKNVRGQNNYIGCILSNYSNSLVYNRVEDSVLNFTYKIPNNVFGQVKILALGSDEKGNAMFDSLNIFVNEKTTLDSIKMFNDSITMPLSTYRNIYLNGYYEDTVHEIGEMSDISYTIIDTNIVSFINNRTVYAKQEGSTSIIATYQGFSDTIYITVYKGFNYYRASFQTDKNILCGNEDVQFFDESGKNQIGWQWSFPGGSPSNSTDQNPVVSYGTPGEYDVQLITTWADKQDTLFVPAYIKVRPAVSAQIILSGSANFCKGDSAQLSANDAVYYLWSSGANTQSIEVKDSGKYYVTVADSFGCKATSATINITVNPKPITVIIPLGTTVFCQGGSVELSASDSTNSYLWSNGDTTPNINVNSTGNYKLTSTNQFDCSTADSVTVTVNPLPFVNAGNDAKIAIGSSVTIGGNPTATGNAPFIYGWQPTTGLNSSVVANPSASPDTTTHYTVQVTDANGCINTDNMMVEVVNCDSLNIPTPTISAIGDSILKSSVANYYEWFLNNDSLDNATSQSLHISKIGFYRVETSPNNLCWVFSLDYPVIVTQNPLSDTLKMTVYPNPSKGYFNVDVKLPETTGVTTYVSVYDVNGTLILQTNKLVFFGNEIKIPITLAIKGTFFIKVYINGDTRQQTLVNM